MKRDQFIAPGFTLVEVLVVLALVAIVAGAFAPAVYRQVHRQRIDTTRAEIEAIFDGLVGNPDRGDYGFVGDLGSLPQSLEMLNGNDSDGNQVEDMPPIREIPIANGPSLAVGWGGPYVRNGQHPFLDAWGSSYRYVFGQSVDQTTRIQIASNGPDRAANTEDDIVLPGTPSPIQCDVILNVEFRGPQKKLPLQGKYLGLLHYPDGQAPGELATLAQEVDLSLPASSVTFLFSGIPLGQRVVQVFYQPPDSQAPPEHLASRSIPLDKGGMKNFSILIDTEDIDSDPGLPEEPGGTVKTETLTGISDGGAAKTLPSAGALLERIQQLRTSLSNRR